MSVSCASVERHTLPTAVRTIARTMARQAVVAILTSVLAALYWSQAFAFVGTGINLVSKHKPDGTACDM